MFKLIFSFFCLILIIEPSLAQKLVIHPKKGEIHFTSKTIIKDQQAFDNAINQKREKLVEALLSTFNGVYDSAIVDSNFLKRVKSEMKDQPFKVEDFDYHQVYLDTIIKSYITNADTLVGDYTVISIKKSTFVIHAEKDVLKTVTSSEDFAFSKNNEVMIQEFRKERKVINGYNCFKVIYKYKIDFSDVEEVDGVDILGILGVDQINTTEFWVTEKIQSLFHPICKEKEILEKYYPLEILQETSFFKGMKMFYTLKSISLSN
ncbi:hypothetical protein EZ428_05760 [Pedobacter frigiditerrae]|uniref:Uncharacterized protein n=1 Tax=Pedobacter frigiditerrae TaxID=2530452 RepID=A0A4R0N365_9SPHI|nr:hypothetical protein [Pedobacter frigiditerrae]TCC94281.1 hypothetical protein EZ428_05760 [Pedobacter frigiditerrae]